jgi:hypothetical protein
VNEIQEDLFAARTNSDVDAIVITTNGWVKEDGKSVMGRGCALRAKRLISDLDVTLGTLVSTKGNHVHLLRDYHIEPSIVSFPVKDIWWELAEFWLIERSCQELVELVTTLEWETVWMVRPGCGSGGLDWINVKPILEKYLDGRFTVCSL